MNFILKHKKYIIIIFGLILIFSLLGGRSPEKTAKKFIDAMYSGDAKKCVSMMSDELILKLQENADLATKKLVINKFQESLDLGIENYKSQYGKKWKYAVEIIDIYEIDDDMMEAVFNTNFKGKGLFKEKDGREENKIRLVKIGKKWYVDSF